MYIPRIAYGTWIPHSEDATKVTANVATAIKLGYTHIDTAQSYGTESYAIQGIINSGISRENIFLTSKIQSIQDSQSLKFHLGEVKYYDLLLLHYPPLGTGSRTAFKEAILKIWAAMQTYIHDDIALAIGVSNFYQNHLEILLEVCRENNFIFPLVNQIEMHPGNLELDYIPVIQDAGITPFAHTPLGGLGSQYFLENATLVDVGKCIGATPAQVILAYLLSRGIGVVTSSQQLQHMEESIRARDFHLTPEDIMSIVETGFGPIVEGSVDAWDDNTLLC